MVERWRGVVNGVLYRVQFEPKLDDELAAWIAERIVTEPKHVTADEQYADLVRALSSDAQLTS
jgi:hypothetical protein